MKVSAILNGKNDSRKNNQLIRPVQPKRGTKTNAVECSYQLLHNSNKKRDCEEQSFFLYLKMIYQNTKIIAGRQLSYEKYRCIACDIRA